MFIKICPMCNIEFKALKDKRKTCSVPCGLKHRARNTPGSNPEVFWSKIVEDTASPLVNGVHCKNWTGGKSSNGYGELSIGNKHYAAHRMAYELSKGKIPSGLVVRHLCHRGSLGCCEPKHLEVGTAKENTGDILSADRHSRGTRRYNAKLNEELVVQLRLLNQFGWSHSELARDIGMSLAPVHKAIVGVAWTHVKTTPLYNCVLFGLLNSYQGNV